jgi:hypothetical protein
MALGREHWTQTGILLLGVGMIVGGVTYIDRGYSNLDARLSRIEASGITREEHTVLLNQNEECRTELSVISATQLMYGHRLDELERRVFGADKP